MYLCWNMLYMPNEPGLVVRCTLGFYRQQLQRKCVNIHKFILKLSTGWKLAIKFKFETWIGNKLKWLLAQI